MNEHAFVLCVCILTVVAHVGLLWTRGWVIGQLWKEFNKMRAQWLSFKEEQEKWHKDFENDHQLPWTRTDNTRKTA